MKNKTKQKLVTITSGIVLIAAAGTAAYVFGSKPDVVNNPCHRCFYRADGHKKMAFDSPAKANWQTVKQFVLHGEICSSYQVGDKYYTGHSRNAWCRSINPFK